MVLLSVSMVSSSNPSLTSLRSNFIVLSGARCPPQNTHLWPVGVVSETMGGVGVVSETMGGVGVVSETMGGVGVVSETMGGVGVVSETMGVACWDVLSWVSLPCGGVGGEGVVGEGVSGEGVVCEGVEVGGRGEGREGCEEDISRHDAHSTPAKSLSRSTYKREGCNLHSHTLCITLDGTSIAKCTELIGKPLTLQGIFSAEERERAVGSEG